MRTSKNGKKKCLGMFFCGYNHMLCKMSSSWGMCTQKNKKCLGTFLTNTNYMLCTNSGSLSMCTPKNKKKEMSGYVFDEYKLYVVQKQR